MYNCIICLEEVLSLHTYGCENEIFCGHSTSLETFEFQGFIFPKKITKVVTDNLFLTMYNPINDTNYRFEPELEKFMKIRF